VFVGNLQRFRPRQTRPPAAILRDSEEPY
jgi:hypothetical protein